MANKKTQVLKSANVDSTIDMRVSKGDIIELMIAEEEARLELAHKTAEENYKAFIEEVKQQIFSDFKKKNNNFVKSIEKEYGKEFKVLIDSGCGSKMFMGIGEEFTIKVKFDEVTMKKADELSYKTRDLRNEFCRFRANEKKNKVAFTRKFMEMTKEGNELLNSLKNVRLTLPASKGDDE
jgi:hypothetical protein